MAANALAHKPVEVAHHEAAPGQENFQDSIGYTATNEAGSIFEGVASQPVQSQTTVTETAAAAHSGGQNPSAPIQNSDSAVQSNTEVKAAVSDTSSVKISTAGAVNPATPTTTSTKTVTEQLTTSLTAANGPPASQTVTQTTSNKSVTSSSGSNENPGNFALSSANSSNLQPSTSGSTDLSGSISAELALYQDGSVSGTVTENLGDMSLGGVLNLTSVSLVFNVTNSGGTLSGTVSVTATSASLNLGGAVTSTIGAINGSYDVTSHQYSLTMNSINIAFSSFVNINAASASLTYNDSGSTTATITDGTNTTTKDVSVVTVGISSATVFAGMNGPDTNAGAVGVKLDGVNLALALMSASDGTTYYGLDTTVGTLAPVGLPDGLSMSATDLQVQVNGGNDGNNAVDFDTTFGAGGLAVPTGSGSINLDYTQQYLQAKGTIELDFKGFVYVQASLAIQSSGTQTVTLAGGTTTKDVSLLTIGASDVTIFAGMNGPSTNPDAVGVELQNAGFALALMSTADGTTYYGLDTTVGTLHGVGLPDGLTMSATDLQIQINSSNDSGGNVVDFDTSFVSGTGLTVATGPSSSVDLDFTGQYFKAAGTIELDFKGFVYIQASLAIESSGTQTVTLTDGTTTTTKDVSLLTIGASDVTIFAGMNGPSTNPDAVGVELQNAGFALALMSAADGTTYYGLDTTAGMLHGVGLPDGLTMSATDLEIQINSSNDSGGNVVDFDSSFVSGTGLTVATGPSSSVDLDFTGQYFKAAGTIELDFKGFVYIQASLAIESSGTQTVTLTDGTTTTTKDVSLLTIGASDVTIFAGMNGPSTNPDAVGVELQNAGFALALMSAADGTTYYGLDTTAGMLHGVGLPDGLTMSATDLEIQINSSNDSGGNVVDFDSSFVSGTGLTVATGPSSSVDLDFTGQYFKAAGTIELDFKGFVYIQASLAIESSGTQTVTLTDGTTTTTKDVSLLTIGASDVTIFAGINGPSTNPDAVGVELDHAGFALALMGSIDGKSYYGVAANATSLVGVNLSSSITVGAGNLDVQINGSNDGNNVVDFDTSFVSGTGLTVATGPSTSTNLDFTGSYLRVAGSLDLGVADKIHISGGFSFTKTSDEIDINVGHTAFDGADDLSFVVGPEASPYFSATGFLSMTITSSALTISDASMTVDNLTIGSFLEADTLTVAISNLSVDLSNGDVSGVTDASGVHDPILTISVASATLFPDGGSVTGSVTATPSGDGLGFQGTFDLSSGAFDIQLEQFHLAIGTTFTADASGVSVTYDPANIDPHQQLVQIGDATLDFKVGSGDITGSVTNLTIYKDGFHFDSVTLSHTGNINVGSVLTIKDPSVTLTDFGMTFGGSVAANGTLTVSAANISLNLPSITASGTNLSITIALDPDHLGDLTISAGSISFAFSTYVSMQATSVNINTAPADGEAYLSVTSATISVALGSGPSLTGTATNFSVINSGGSVAFYEGIPGDDSAVFSVSVTATPGQLGLPTWLGFQIQKLELRWDNFAADPAAFTLVLSASINSISGLPGGVIVNGEITDAVIDFGKLEAGGFPITSIGSFGGSIKGTLFGMEVNAGFILGIVNFNADGNIVNLADNTVSQVITNTADGSVTQITVDSAGVITQVVTHADGTSTTTHPTSGGPTFDTTVTGTTMYVGVAGGAEIPGVGGVQIYIGFSSLGPLTFYLSAEFPLILDPDTGLAIGGFSGGVLFDYTLPTPSRPQDLANITISEGSVTLSQWQQQLRQQTITQYTASGGGTDMTAAYNQPFVIEAGVTLYDAYATENAFSVTGNLAIQIDPANASNVKLYVTGLATFGDSISFNAYLYLNVDASTPTPSVTVMFLVQEPAAPLTVESFGGTLKFGFTDSDGNPLTPPTVAAAIYSEWIALGTTYDSSGTAVINNLPSGTYVWTPGANDISLMVNGTTYTTADEVNGQVTFTTTSTEDVTLTGTANASISGTLGSLNDWTPATTYNGSGSASISNLPAGIYVWTPGANDTSLTIGSTTYQASDAVNGRIVITVDSTSNVTLAGTANDPVTGTLLLQGAQYTNTTFAKPTAAGGFYISITGFLQYQVPDDPNVSVSINGAVTLTVTTTKAKLDLWGDLNVSFLGDIAEAQGEFVIDYTTPSSPTFYGALVVKSGTGLAKLQQYGLTLSGALMFQINTTGADQTVNLPNAPPTGGPPTGTVAPLDNSNPFTIQGSVLFDLTILGVDPSTNPYATISYEVHGDTLFQMEGFFDLRLTDNGGNLGLQMFADINTLTMGSSSSPFLSFSGFGLFIMNDQGLAAEISLNLNAGNDISGISFTANFNLIINTTSQDVTYTIPSITVPSSSGSATTAGIKIYSYDSSGNATLAGTVSTLVIPAGPPLDSPTIQTISGTPTGTFGSSGAAGPYVVIMGGGQLSLFAGSGNEIDLHGYFYFQMSDSPSTGFTLVLALNVSGDIAGVGAGATVTGALQISSAGEVALLDVSGHAGSTTDYGSGITFQLNAQLGINTTGSQVTEIGGITLDTPIDAHSWKLVASGTLTLGVGGADIVINGVFSIGEVHSDSGHADDVTTTTIQAGGTVTATVGGDALLTMQVSGELVASYTTSAGTSSSTVYGALVLTANGGDPLSGSGFAFNGSFLLEVNTTGAVQNPDGIDGNPLMFDGQAVVLSKGAGGSSTAGDYVQFYAVGTLAFGTPQNGFILLADPHVDASTQGLFISVSSSGLAVSVGVKMSIVVGGTNLLGINATGAMLISSSGFAASITVTATMTDPNSLYAFDGTFTLQVNTTGAAQHIGPATIPAGPNGSATGAPYFQMHINGTLALGGTDTSAGTGMLMTGDFYLTISPAGLAVTASATLNLKVGGSNIFSFTANGALLINSNGIAAKITLSITAGSSNNGFGFDASVNFVLLLNSTGSAITTINNQTVNLPGGSFYLKVTANGTLKLAGFVNVSGSFTLTIGNDADGHSAVVINFAASANIFGIVFSLSGDAGIYHNGIAIDLNLSIGGTTSGAAAAIIPGVLTVQGTFTLQLNLTGDTHFGIAGTTAFKLEITNFTVYVFGFSMVGGNGHPTQLEFLLQTDGSFYCSGSLDFNFFGFGDVSITFDFDSSGHYTFTGSLGVRLGSSDFNIHGTLTVRFSNESTPNFELRVDGGATAFGYDFASIGADVQINGSSVDISVYVSVDLGLFSVGGTIHIHLGSLANVPTPPPPHIGTVLSSSTTIDGQNFGAGTLVLNIGPYADSSRGVASQSDENYTVTYLGAGTTPGTINVSVSAPGVYGHTIEYDNVSQIVVPEADNSNVTVQISGNVTVPVYIFAGGGTNQFFTGGGQATITGSTGNDTVVGGSGGVIFHAGSGTSIFIGGHGNNTIYDPGTVSIVEGYTTTTLVGGVVTPEYLYYTNYSLSGSTLTYSDGSGTYTDSLVGTFSMITLTAPSSGATTFAVSNYSGNVTLNANGNSSVTTSITLDIGNLTVNGSSVAQSNGGSGTITLQGINTMGLYGGTGANTFTVNSWSGSGAVTLDGKGGSDTYNINFQSSGSFTANISDSGLGGTDSVIVNGTTGNDTIHLADQPDNEVTLGSQTVKYSGVESLTVYSKTGNDTIDIAGVSIATTINTGSGTNTINIGTNAFTTNSGGTLNNISGVLAVNGGGTETLNLDDTGDSGANTGTLTSSSLTGIFGSGGSLNYAGVETFNLNMGSGGNTLGIQSSSTGATNINSGSGNDTINIQGMNGTMLVNTGIGSNQVNVGSAAPSSSGNLKNIKGALTITGGGATTMNVDDTGDTGAASGTLTGTTIKGLGMGSSGITYTSGTITTLNISLGSGGNTFTITNTNAATNTTLNSGSGKDTVNLTTDSGTTTVNGQNGDDTINVFADTATTNINGNGGDDTINIQSTAATTNVNTGSGTNTVNIGSKAPSASGDVAGIQGAVIVTGSSADTLNVDDTGATTGETGLLTSTTLTGLGMGPSGISYSGLSSLNISLGSHDDTMNVQSTHTGTLTTINTGAGANIVNVADNAPSDSGGVLTGIAGELVVNGQGADTLNVDDTGDTGSGILTETSVSSTAATLTGLGLGANGIEFENVETLNVNLGAHGNTIYIKGNPSVTTFNLNTGSGTNVIGIGSHAGTSISTTSDSNSPNDGDATNTGSVLDYVQGIINITGSGNDSMVVDDSGSTTAEGGGLWSDKLQFLDPVTINFSGIIGISISLSEGNDQFAVADTITSSSTSPVIVIDGNSGDDTFVIFDTHAVATINGGDGDDNFYNFGNSSVLNLNGNAGDDTFYIYASVSEDTTNVGPGAADSNGNQVYSYRVNARVNIDGGSGNDKVFIFATVLNDVITIDGTHVTGAGIDVSFTNVEQLVVAGLGGDDTFYIESIAIPTTVIGDGTIVLPDVADFLSALGLTLPDTTGGAPAPTSFSDTFFVGWQGASYIPGSLAGIVAPLTIYGDDGPGLGGITTNTPNTTDTIYVDDSGDIASRSFTLTATTLSGTGFGSGGLMNYDSAVENLNFYTGNGNNTITINGNDTAFQTSIYGGRGNDTFIVNDDPLMAPLALFGGLNTVPGDTLTVNGAVDGNTFDVTAYTIDGAGATITYEEMETLTINAGGATTFNVNGDSIPTYLNGGADDDAFNINSNVVSLYLTSGAGDNTYVINANSGFLTATGDSGLDAGNDNFTINGNSGTIMLNGGANGDTFTINGNSGSLTANGGAGDDSFTVNALSAPATINGGTGNDNVTITGPLAASLTVNGGGDSGDWLTIDATIGNDFVTVTNSVVTGVGAAINYSATNLVINGMAGNDTFQINSTSSYITRINGGIYGDDIFNVQANAGTLYLNGGAIGNNTFNLGSLSPIRGGTLVNIVGPVYIAGGTNVMRLITLAGGGINTVNVDDTGDVAGESGTLTASALTGLGMGTGVTFVSVDVMNINLGSGNDTFNVQSTNATTVTTLNTGAGTNTINVGSLAPSTGGIVDGIQGALIVQGSNNDTMNVDDTGSTGSKTGTLTPTTLTGLGMGASGITYGGLATLNISLGSGGNTFTITDTYGSTVTTLNSGSSDDTVNVLADSDTTYINGQDGNDTINVQSTGATTTVNTGAGTNTINVGSLAPSTGGIVDGIQGALIVQGSNNDTMNVDDTGSTGSKTGTLTPTTLTGLGMGVSGITYSGLSALNISLGSGGNTFTITDTYASTVTTLNSGSSDDTVNVLADSDTTYINGQDGNDTINVQSTGATTTVNTGAGTNTINVGSLAPSTGGIVDGIQGALIVQGSNNDTMNVDDTGSTGSKTGTLTPTTLTGLGMGVSGITYSGLSALNISLGSGGNTFTITDTYASTVTTLNSGSSDDTVNVLADSDTTYINGQDGNDTINVQSTGATTTVNTGAGTNTINVGSLAPSTGGIVDGIQGALIVQGSNNDTMNVDDTGDSAGQTGTLTSTTLTGLGMGAGGITYSGLAALNINLGSGNDTFNVRSTYSSTVTTLNTGSGANTINIGSLMPSTDGIVDGIQGSLVVVGSGTDTMNVDDTGSTGSKTGTLTSTMLTGLGMGTDGITYSGLTALNINLGSGDDTFNVQSTNATTVTTLNTGAGANTINVGSLTPSTGGIVDGIQGALIVQGSNNDTMNVDDTGSTGSKTGTLTPTTLTGLGMGASGITYSGLSVLNISLGSGGNIFTITDTYGSTVTTLNSGSGDDTVNLLADSDTTYINGQDGNDTINVQSTGATTTVNTGAGTNTVNVGSNAPATSGTTDGIQGALIVQGSNNDTMNVDDTGDSAGQTGTLTSTTLTGLGMGAGGITYSGLAALNINLGSGNDTFNVRSTYSATVTTLNTGDGTNTVNVGSNAPATGGVVGGIQGSLIVVGSGNDTLNVDDTGDTADSAGTLTATTLTGLGMGASGITYSGLAALNINLGSGNDTFTVTGVTDSTVTTVDGRSGTNTAVLNFSGNFAGVNLTMLNFATGTLYVGGNFSGLLNFSGDLTTVTIVGSLTSTGVLNSGAIDTMTVGGDLAGLLNVTGLLGTLTVDGGTPGEIIAGDIHIITVLAGYGNSVLHVIEGGIEREILATPTAGGTMPNTVHFAFVYDSQTAADPQLAIRITDTNPVARSFNLALLVTDSSTAKFNLSRLDSYMGGMTGVGNISVAGDILTQLTTPELQLFTDLTAASRAGVVLPVDNITGVEVSGRLPIGFIDIAGLEGLAFAIVTTPDGIPVNVSNPLGQGTSLSNLLGSNAVVNPATDAFVVPFNETNSVRLFAHDNTSLDLEQVMTLTDQLNDNLPIVAYVQIVPTTNNSVNPLVQSVTLAGSGGSINSSLSIANITSTGSLGDVTITASSGSTVNNAPGLGNVTAASIFGNINVTNAGIYGVIQTTSGDIGRVILGTGGQITGVTSIISHTAMTGQIISRGDLVSSVSVGGAFSGVIAAQGDVGAIQRDSGGNAVVNGSNALTRFGGISISGADSGQIIALGNVFGNLTVNGTMTGRIAVEGQSVAGLDAARFGILGNINISSFALGSAIISGGRLGDSTGNTTAHLGNAQGFVAAEGSVNLSSTTIAADNLLQNVQSGANFTAINAVFTDGGLPLLFDTGGSLNGLTLIETDLANIQDNSGTLSGVIS